MAPQIILTRGLPGSGKTFWAKEYQKTHPDVVRVNKDDLRAMLHNSVHSKEREKFVLKMRNFAVEQALSEGHDVIVDDTNFNPEHELALLKLISEKFPKATLTVQDFTWVPLEECIKRDSLRSNGVGVKVIRTMYDRHLKPIPPVVEVNPKLSNCIICDLDGTLCLFPGKNPYERDFENDIVNPAVHGIIDQETQMNSDVDLLFFSGRADRFRKQTQDFLSRHHIYNYKLFMRGNRDERKDSVVKLDMYNENVKDKYNVKFVLDDRDQVVSLWRSLGLTCFQVAEGNF